MTIPRDQELVSKANSAQILLDYLLGDKDNFAKPFNPRLALELLRQDPITKSIVKRNTAKIMEGGWYFNTEERESMMKKFRKDYKFTKLLRTISSTIQYQDVLIEIVKKDNKVTDLNLLDPANIEVAAKANGDIEYWYQENRIEGTTKGRSIVKWNPENVVHITYEDAILNVWGENQLKSAYDTLLIKDYIRTFVLWLFKTNQFRTHYNIQDANEPSIKAFISRLKQGESSYDKPVITTGEAVAKPLREISDLATIQTLLDWCDSQLVSLLGQTTVGIGMGGSGGRSESDSLGDVLRSVVKDIQNIITEAVNYELLPKMGYPVKDTFVFAPMDRMTKRQLMETIEIMRRSGWKDEAIVEFANQEGLSFKTSEWFQPPVVQNGMTSQARKDGAPSRQRSAEGQADKNVGTGQAATTRKEQLVSKASTDFNSYPYVYTGDIDAV